MLAPGYKEIADYFKKMAKELEAKPEEYGCEDTFTTLILPRESVCWALTSPQVSECPPGSTSATALPRMRS